MDGNYHVPSGTIATPEDPPLYLVEGLFYDGQELLAEAITPPEVDGELLNSVRLSVTGYEEELTVRMLNTAEGTLYRISEDGELSELPYSRDGSYLVFRIPNGSSFCYVENSEGAHNSTLSLYCLETSESRIDEAMALLGAAN